MPEIFVDRRDAGRRLAEKIADTPIAPTCSCWWCRVAVCRSPMRLPACSTHLWTSLWFASSRPRL